MRLSKEVVRALEQTGKSWEIREGSRHLKIFVGRRLVGILPKSGRGHSADRAEKNTVAQIRRAARDNDND